MFNVQKSYANHEIYINYNELLDENEDESIPTLEHIIKEGDNREYSGTIDLISVKMLTSRDILKLKSIHDVLGSMDIANMHIISDNSAVLEQVKKIIPGAVVELFRIEKKR